MFCRRSYQKAEPYRGASYTSPRPSTQEPTPSTIHNDPSSPGHRTPSTDSKEPEPSPSTILRDPRPLEPPPSTIPLSPRGKLSVSICWD